MYTTVSFPSSTWRDDRLTVTERRRKERSWSQSSGNIKFKTYTTTFFELHKDVDIEDELMDAASLTSPSPPPTHSRTHSASSATRPPELQQHSSFGNSLGVPTVAGLPRLSPSNSYQGASPAGSTYSTSPSQPLASLSSYSSMGRPPGWSPTSGVPAYPGYMPTSGPGAVPHPRIVIDTFDVASGGAATTPGHPGHLQGSRTGSGNYLSLPSASSYGLSPASSRGSQSALSSPRSPLPGISPWNESVAGNSLQRSPSVSSAISDPFDETAENFEPYAQVPLATVDTLKRLSLAQPNDQHYMKHFFACLAGHIVYPDRGYNNPFRQLISILCPDDEAVLHAVLAYSAADMHYNVAQHAHVDSVKALGDAELHFDHAQKLLKIKMLDGKWLQSTAAQATCYFINLTRVKHLQDAPMDLTMEVVSARAQAGRSFEGGIWLTWLNAVIGILSGMFGGRPEVMMYMIEHELVPTPGQGNMYPFIKKTEDERIEHTVISPMYAVQLKVMGVMAKLGMLGHRLPEIAAAKDDAERDARRAAFETDLTSLQDELEEAWSHRPKLIDELLKDSVEEIFLTRWIGGVPTAQLITTFYHLARLYCGVLSPQFASRQVRDEAAGVVARVFSKIFRERRAFLRRGLLTPIVVAALAAPDLSLRQGLSSMLAKCAANEPTWKHAAAVASKSVKAMRDAVATGKYRPDDLPSVSWQELVDDFHGLTMM